MSRWEPYPAQQIAPTKKSTSLIATHRNMQVSIATGEDIARLEHDVQASNDQAQGAQRQAEQATQQLRDVEANVSNGLDSVRGELSEMRSSITQMTTDRNVTLLCAKERMLAEAECQEFLASRLRARAENLLPTVENEASRQLPLRLLADAIKTSAKDAHQEAVQQALSLPEDGKTIPDATPSSFSEDHVQTDPLKRVDSPLQKEQHDIPEQETVDRGTEKSLDSPQQNGIESQRSVGVTADLPPAGIPAVAPWTPFAVEQMKRHSHAIPASHTQTFSWEQLHHDLRGEQYSPGLYLVKPTNPSKPAVLSGRTYWLLESKFEPFAPSTRGEHGAKLTAFFNDTLDGSGNAPADGDYMEVPVFVCLNGAQEYTYMGTYSQNRFSDKLSHSELHQRVPKHVLEYWAETLSDKDRPQWVTDQLIEQFWPKPKYEGPIPTDSAIASPTTTVTAEGNPEAALEKRVARSLEKYAETLKKWRKDAELHVGLLSKDALMGSWDKSDIDREPGLRLWLEYLECTGYDEQLYNGLVARKQKRSSKPRTAPSTNSGLGQYDLPLPAGPAEVPKDNFIPTKKKTAAKKASASTSDHVAETKVRDTQPLPWDDPK